MSEPRIVLHQSPADPGLIATAKREFQAASGRLEEQLRQTRFLLGDRAASTTGRSAGAARPPRD